MPAFEDVDAVVHLAQPVHAAPPHGADAEAAPFVEDVGEVLLARAAVEADHHQVDRRGGLEAGVGQQQVGELGDVLVAALGLEHQAHRRVLARLVAHPVEGGQHQGLELGLVGVDGFLAGLGLWVGEGLDLEKHLLGRDARRQLGDHQLPLAAGEILDHPAGAQLEAAAAGFIGLADVGGG